MNIYKVEGKQVVYFSFDVEAENEDEARELASDFYDPITDIINEGSLEIYDVTLIEDDEKIDY